MAARTLESSAEQLPAVVRILLGERKRDVICQFKKKAISAGPLSERNVKMKSPEANLYGLCGRMITRAPILRWKRLWKEGRDFSADQCSQCSSEG
jgi:hypothetical protein